MGHTRFNEFVPLNAIAVSGTNTYLSAATSVPQQHNIGYEVVFTGTMTGTFSVQYSADGTTFDDLTFSPAITQPSGSALTFGVSINQFPFQYIRLKYVNASGSGTLTVTLNSKDLS